MKTIGVTDMGLLSYLAEFVSENKKNRIAQVLESRTNYLTLVLEDIYQSQNASATIRTCDCMGVQNVHIIENRNKYTLNPKVTSGSGKWVTLTRYDKAADNTAHAMAVLKNSGYMIVGTTPSTSGSMSIQDISLDKPIALVFGNEEKGIGKVVEESSDYLMHLPMYGFTESFNLSVSVGITLSYLLEKIRRSTVGWHLKNEEKSLITLEWYRKIIKKSKLLENEYYRMEDIKREKP